MSHSALFRGAAIVAFLLALQTASPAAAALRATASVQSASGGTRLAVNAVRQGRLTARQRPRAMAVRRGGRAYRLRRPRARTGLGIWRSKVYRGAAGARVASLAGKRVRIVVRTRSGLRSLRTRVRGGAAVPPPPATASPFERPPRALKGDAAFAHIGRYFDNSRFTDCPAGQSSCATEERYDHCAGGGRTGNMAYTRLPAKSESDLKASGPYTLTGAVAYPNGSWGVEYTVLVSNNETRYAWNVAADGSATGLFTGPQGEQEELGPLRWQQPSGC